PTGHLVSHIDSHRHHFAGHGRPNLAAPSRLPDHSLGDPCPEGIQNLDRYLMTAKVQQQPGSVSGDGNIKHLLTEADLQPSRPVLEDLRIDRALSHMSAVAIPLPPELHLAQLS